MASMSFIEKYIKNKLIILIIAWLILTIINLNKAFHIDDSFHLEAAKNIINHPLKPMSGLINWGDVPTPMYKHNQPPLLFYALAVTGYFFGFNEISIHFLISIFTFLSLLFFQKIILVLYHKFSSLLFVLFAFSPALIVNQNIMTDVPLLSFILISFYYLIKATETNQWKYYIISALFIAFGILTKYTIIPIFLVLFIVIYLKKDYAKLSVILIPVVALILWSIWNYIEYGSVHLLDRPKKSFNIKNIIAFISLLGAISTYTYALIRVTFPSKKIKLLTKLFVLFLLLSFIIFYFGNIDEKLFSYYLNTIFSINGFVLIFFALRYIYTRRTLHFEGKYKELILVLFFFSLSSFLLLFAPFMASRHLLLVFPFVLLMSYPIIEKASYKIKIFIASSGFLLGILLGISDYQYANFYREMAQSSFPKAQTKWSVGHWGWQWYAIKNGLIEYDTLNNQVKINDLFIFPKDIPKQKIRKNIQLKLIDKKWKEANLSTFLSGNNFASMYNSYLDKPAWTLSKKPIDTIYVYKVVDIKND
jgi:4-amino-4-deoxy-L-arabinose transferase-like glycosyltransferase